ncbi:L-serine ammonia-lyase [Leisingera thetidis]|uniref:L-serine ammonia-lyase n=1 Tax=Leisingera thetidis TaxID=2930199 RepID=UPI0021F766FC|nr:L-serine ammonia-lyase [Leisingera thetidis]
MFLSIFDIFKIGIGPSSSHTMGPMVAASRFLSKLENENVPIARFRATLHGSLAFTGKGHGSDRAVILGLAGFEPETFAAQPAERALEAIKARKTIVLEPFGEVRFAPENDLVFDFEKALPLHPNGLTLEALDEIGHVKVREQYYSVGGGFVATAQELVEAETEAKKVDEIPYPFATAAEMLKTCAETGLSISELKMANERAYRSETEVTEGIARIWKVMQDCIDNGLENDGILPGGLNVRRRAKALHGKLLVRQNSSQKLPENHTDWVISYAMAVNEENAAGGRIVTAPTNGAAGVIPAVIAFWQKHMQEMPKGSVQEFFLTAAAIGGLIKHNASISGAECGCQAEVGSAAAMAAAGLAAVRGGTPEQIENAAEIALEHHLGMTCDPIKGLVQIPCIERNGLGAIKALAAASLALHGDGKHIVHLDDVIETMWQTGQDMHESYKETSLGGLAINVPNC